MSELKRTFTGGKMNKDLDERFVPKNQYRHAVNVQVRESDSDAAGTVQNLQGNVIIGETNFATWMTGNGEYYGFNMVGDNPGFYEVVEGLDENYPVCIAGVADEKNDKGYFFFTHDVHYDNDIVKPQTLRKWIDTIVQQDVNGLTTRVVNDHWATSGGVMEHLPMCGQPNVIDEDCYQMNENGAGSVTTTGEISNIALESIQNDGWTKLLVKDGRNYRVGMTMHAYGNIVIGGGGSSTTLGVGVGTNVADDDEGNLIDLFAVGSPNPKIKAIEGNVLTFDQPISYNVVTISGTDMDFGFTLLSDIQITNLVFKHPKALNFDIQKVKQITGINVIDNLLFWTDNCSEPKKINIDRCIAGTVSNYHTKLFLDDNSFSSSLVDSANLKPNLEVHNGYWNNVKNRWDINSDLQESHLTVLRKAPTYAPTIKMSDSERTSMGGTVDVLVENYSFVTTEGELSEFTLNVGDIRTIIGDNLSQTRFRRDDILEITEQGVNPLLESFIVIKAKFMAYEDEFGAEVFTGPTNRVKIKVISIEGDTVSPEDLNWRIKLLERDPLFETKFVRFGCRYKYEDGEYSTFGPWSRLAFLPGQFDYSAKNGYNLGMVNNVRELIIRDFIAYDIPQDVVEIDILYKATDNANVYTAQTITRNKSPEWDMFTPQVNSVEINTGELYITSEMIHRVLPEMQLFRSWDNVPRYALAQEIVANRLVYGNYYQGYNMEKPIRLTQTISSDASTTLSEGYPSLKSLRNYRVGVVFGDKYGRETPVFTNGYVTNAGTAGDIAVSGDIYIDKNLSATKNRFLLSQDWTDPSLPGISNDPPDWLIDGGYIKYFIKETSNEYYNLVLDRWYDSGDETIWLSFNSADRNKVDEETYLILKNQHTTHKPVFDNAKYKILAIENQAPDYIRTRYVNLGEVKDLTPDNTDSMWPSDAVNNEVSPSLLYNLEPDDPGNDGFSFKISDTAWNTGSVGFASDETEGIFGMEITDPIELQFIGRRIENGIIDYELTSEWRKISNYNKDGDNDVRFLWTKAFKDDDTGGVDFPSIYAQLYPDLANVFDTGVSLQWAVKFRMAIKENRPEFEGRFFVKINKDMALVNHVMDLGVGIGGTWVPEEEFQLSYIDSQFENPTSNDMVEDPLGGTISKFSSWGPGEDLSYVTWFGAFNMLQGNGSNNYGYNDWSPQIDGAPDPRWFDAPYWADGVGTYGTNSNTIPYLYNGSEADDDFGMLALLDTEYYGWNTNTNYNSNGVVPYMPFVPLEFLPGTEDSEYVANDDLSVLEFSNAQDSIWGVTGFVDWCESCGTEYGQLVGLQFVPGAGGPGNNGTQGVAPANPYGAGIFGGTCGPMFEWYDFNEATKQFWQDYAVSYAPGGGITSSSKTGGHVFLDGAGARRYLTTIKNEATAHNISYGETVYDQNGDIIPNHYYYEYYKPLPLEAGTVENEGSDTGSGTPAGHFGRMNLGITLYNYKQNISINKASKFFDKMTEVGTVFKFTSDPNQQVYKVIWVEDKAWYDDGTMGGPNSRMTSNVHSNYYDQPTGDGFVIEEENNQGFNQLNGTWTNMTSEIGTSGCQPAQSNDIGTDFNVGRRLNCAIEFRKINLDTGGTSAAGMDISNFDPRSKARHDGSSSMGVQVMRLGFNYDSLEADDSLSSTELGACFETEPKEDVGLDLYYEASNAVPIVLTRENMLNYTPINSSIYILRKSAGVGDIIKRIKFPQYLPKVRNIYSKRDSDGSTINSRGVIVSLAQTSTVEPILFNKEIWPTDTLVFEHQDGTETQSKVINYVEPIDYTGDGISSNNITTNEFVSGVVEHPRAFKVVDPVSIQFWVDVNDTDNNSTKLTIQANTWNSNYSDIDILQVIGSLITGVEQDNNELLVPHGLFVQDFIFNDFEYPTGSGNIYHTLIIGGDATGFVATPLNPSPPVGIQGENDVKLSISPRTGYYEIDPDVWKYPVKLGWFNCYGFGNGVESDRIRDDFNAPTITNGVKVSTTVVGYGEENISSGMIYSGLYNSTSQMNNLNEFNMAEKVTKDLNPAYGSIQALKTRDTDVVVFAEDKVLKVIANKDAVYNADGNPQLVATNRTLGQAITFAGDYGISKNPESLASDQYRMYFTDKQRGAVLRLSRDGLTPISDVGMKTWFRHQLRYASNALGTFDNVSGEYNLTLDPIYNNSTQFNTGDAMNEVYTNTVSFNEKSKGWVSFKSFVPTNGVSVSGNYFTTSDNKIWRHYAPSYKQDGSCSGAFSNLGCSYRNSWYDSDPYESEIVMVFNDKPSIVKSFKTLDYEGSQAKINKSNGENVEWKDGNTETFYDNDFNNIIDKYGWWADNMETDLEKGKVHEFRKKEGKWFHQIGGLSWDYEDSNMVNNRDLITESLDVQGIGITSGAFIFDETVGEDVIQVAGCTDETALNFNNLANYNVVSSCIFQGCSDNRIIGVDILQDNPSYGEGTNMYGKYFASNYIGNVFDNVACDADAGQIFNPLNLEGGWTNAEGTTIGPWTPTCCNYYGCTDASAINYVGDDLAPYLQNCTNDANSVIDEFDTNEYTGTNCEPCAYDCGGGNIEGVGFNATCGCNDSSFLEYWNYAETNVYSVYTLTQPDLLVTYNNEPYHYNDSTQCVTPIIYGCTNANSFNWHNTQNTNMSFDTNANVDDDSCIPITYGCMDATAANYNPNANVDDNTCEYITPEGQLTVQNDENN